MVKIRGAKENEKASVDSPKTEVGEIDTRAPFQSVKAAVNLFVEAPNSNGKPSLKKKLSSKNVIENETQFVLAQRELNKLKQQLENAETVRSQALSDLERAKRTMQELTTKLDAVTESKQSTIAGAEAIKELAKKLEAEMSRKAIGTEAWKRELEQIRKDYGKTVKELHASKQALTEIRQDFDAALEAKLAAFQRAGEAQRSANAGAEKAGELAAELAAMRASVERLALEAQRARGECARIAAEREASLEAFAAVKEAAAREAETLKRGAPDPEAAASLEAELARTSSEVEAVREEMRKAHAAEMESVRGMTRELDEATKRLQEVGDEERSLKGIVSGLKLELESLRKGNGVAASDEQRFALQRLAEEAESAAREQSEMRRNADKVKAEAAGLTSAAEAMEKKLKGLEVEAEEAKARAQTALAEMAALSRGEGETPAKMRLSVEEFNSLTKKVETAQNSAEAKEAESEASVREIRERKMAAETKLEDCLKAIEEIKVATDLALRKAEMAESAKTVVDSELRRWRREEQRSGMLKSSNSTVVGL